MRIFVGKRQSGHIADDVSFKGWLKQRRNFCSDASLYSSDENGSESDEALRDCLHSVTQLEHHASQNWWSWEGESNDKPKGANMTLTCKISMDNATNCEFPKAIPNSSGHREKETVIANGANFQYEAKAQDEDVNHMNGSTDLKVKPFKVVDEQKLVAVDSRRRNLVVEAGDDIGYKTSSINIIQKWQKRTLVLPVGRKEGKKQQFHRGLNDAESVQSQGRKGSENSGKSNGMNFLQSDSEGLRLLDKDVARQNIVAPKDVRDTTLLKSRLVTFKGKASGRSKNVDMQITYKNLKDDIHHVVKGVCASMPRTVALEKDCDGGFGREEVYSDVTEGGDMCRGCKQDEKSESEPNGWVLCDDCHKWRCIPAALANKIEASNCYWTCKENPNKNFADCSIPQEKSNADINAELNISELSVCEESNEDVSSMDSKITNCPGNYPQPRTTWILIKHNIFLHRQRKTLSIDEMICSCVPSSDGSPGCGDDCFNRMLNIECNSQTCPCGHLCSNQEFQKRLYAKVGWFRCGKKGFGLQILEDVRKGSFIIEYVGEVLDILSYESRLKEYSSQGQRHFYFMALNSSEVIDACMKGNLGRFINHSCEPNCTTEKWTINGEVCIGLFAIRDLKKGEEITFNYNFIRVCGAIAKKCLCGSAECRGFIGGDPGTPRLIVENDVHENDPEPIMIEENTEEEETVCMIQQAKNKDTCLHSLTPVKRKWMPGKATERHGISLKRIKANSISHKKVFTEGQCNETSCLDGVEEILNKMLDEGGGICKKQFTAKEAAARYLKLLLQTAASSDTANGEASTSIRDLSVMLDAVLKTLSHDILQAIIEINGLQLLHNMVKQSKRNRKTIPIACKLLKVLEFLAAKNILTKGQINAESSRYGAGSVRETILDLCRHTDTEVQQIACHFKEKWLSQPVEKPVGESMARLPIRIGNHELRSPSKCLQHHGSKPYGNGLHEQHGQAFDNEVMKEQKMPNWGDQKSQEVLDIPIQGLPSNFGSFKACNVLGSECQSRINLNVDPSDSETHEIHLRPVTFLKVGSSDAMPLDLQHLSSLSLQQHPRCPALSQRPTVSYQQPQTAEQTLPRLLSVVNNIPVHQLATGSSASYVRQQLSVCVGVPITQSRDHSIGLSPTSLPQKNVSSVDMLETTPSMEVVRSMLPCAEGYVSSRQPSQRGVNFGVSMSQFFQQMHDTFGPSFHPWMLQSLLAPHAWGPQVVVGMRKGNENILSQSSERSGKWIDKNGVRVVNEPGEDIGPEFESHPPTTACHDRQQYGNEPARCLSGWSQRGNHSPWKLSEGTIRSQWSKFPGHKYKNLVGYGEHSTRRLGHRYTQGLRSSQHNYHKEVIFADHHKNKLMVPQVFNEAGDHEESADCVPLERPWRFD